MVLRRGGQNRLPEGIRKPLDVIDTCTILIVVLTQGCIRNVRNTKCREFRGGLVVRIPGSYCSSLDSIPGQETEFPQNTSQVPPPTPRSNLHFILFLFFQIYILNMCSLLCVSLGSIKVK